MQTIIDLENDWWPDVFQTIRCQCGMQFRGRAQIKNRGGHLVHLIDRECPGCGTDVQVRASYGDPEVWTV